MMPIIPAQTRTQHHQVEPALANRRFHGLSSHGLLYRVPSLLQGRCRNRLFLSIPFTIKNFQLRCFRHECVSSPLTVATPPSSEYITEDQHQPGKSRCSSGDGRLGRPAWAKPGPRGEKNPAQNPFIKT